MRSDEDWLRRHGEALPLYLEDGPAPPIDFLHMRVSPWLQFRRAGIICASRVFMAGNIAI